MRIQIIYIIDIQHIAPSSAFAFNFYLTNCFYKSMVHYIYFKRKDKVLLINNLNKTRGCWFYVKHIFLSFPATPGH